jgi:transposase-like protein
MKPTYDAAVRDAIRKRMSPPNRESVAEIARTTGITTQTLYNWRSQLAEGGSAGAGHQPRHRSSGALPTSWRP